MTRRLRVFMLAISFLLAMRAAAQVEIFVDSSRTTPGDGSQSAPFPTITQALEMARDERFGSLALDQQPHSIKINVHVAAGTYMGSFATPAPAGVETLPLFLNVPFLHLEGALRFDTGHNPVPGTETIVRASTKQVGRQHMIVVTRTNPFAPVEPALFPPSLVMAGDSVTISGFRFDGGGDGTPPGTPGADQSALIFLDGVRGFVIRDNVLTGSSVFGISTRLSSGRIENNSIIKNGGVGLNITGGSEKFPATVVIAGNRSMNNGTGGLGLQGAAQTEGDVASLFAAQRFRQVPLPQFFDWTHRPEEVPDKLDATITNNIFDGNTNGSTTDPRGFGIHVNGYLRENYRLHPLDPERLTAFVRARFVGNSSSLNGNYGVVVVAGQIQTSNSRKHVVNIDVSFEGNTLEGNGTGAAFFGLSRFAPSVSQDEANKPGFKFAHDSTITVCGDIREFNFDNSATDPADQTATNNALRVNKTSLTGFCFRRNCPPDLNATVRTLSPAEAAVGCK